MFKWILVLIIAFLATWIFAKDYIPGGIRHSGFGETLDVMLYPLNLRIRGDSFAGGKFDRSLVNLDEPKLLKLMANSDAKAKPVVIYFYRTDCFICRLVFHQVNELAAAYSDRALFMVVNFDDEDKNKRNKFFLDIEDSLHFRPFQAPFTTFKTAEYFYKKKDIGFSEVPVLLYKDTSGNYQNIGAEFGSKSRLEEIIGK